MSLTLPCSVAVTMPEIMWYVIAAVAGITLLLWCVITCAGSVPVMNLHRARLQSLPDGMSREILFTVLSDAPDLDGDWLRDQQFSPLGVFKADGLPGNPKIVAWQRRGEATWLCGYLLPDGSCQLDLVSQLEDGMLTTGTSRDAHLFPADSGRFVQSFDIGHVSELWQHHRQAADFLETAFGRQIDRQAPDFAECFASSLRAEGEFVRSIFLWPVRIPWWYFTRRLSRHNRPAEDLYR